MTHGQWTMKWADSLADPLVHLYASHMGRCDYVVIDVEGSQVIDDLVDRWRLQDGERDVAQRAAVFG